MKPQGVEAVAPGAVAGLTPTRDSGSDDAVRIHIQGLQFWGCHGVLDEEQNRPQAFEVDLTLTLPPVAQDDLSHTVDYRGVIESLHALNQNRRFRLIEAFAQAIARDVLERFPRVRAVSVRLRKRPALLVGVHLDHIAVEVHARRDRPPPPTSG